MVDTYVTERLSLFLRVSLQRITTAKSCMDDFKMRHELFPENYYDYVVVSPEFMQRLCNAAAGCSLSSVSKSVYRMIYAKKYKGACVLTSEEVGGCIQALFSDFVYISLLVENGHRKEGQMTSCYPIIEGCSSSGMGITKVFFYNMDDPLVIEITKGKDAIYMTIDIADDAVSYGNGEYIKPDIYSIYKNNIDGLKKEIGLKVGKIHRIKENGLNYFVCDSKVSKMIKAFRKYVLLYDEN